MCLPLAAITGSLLLWSAVVQAQYDYCAEGTLLAVEDLPQCGSCEGRCGELTDLGLHGTMCSCDANCVVYRDCCVDFHTACPTEHEAGEQRLILFPEAVSSCTQLYTVNSQGEIPPMDTRLITTCLTGDSCLNINLGPEYDFSRGVPVADVETGIYFPNHDCAKCNNVTRVVAMDIYLACTSNDADIRGYDIADNVTALLEAMEILPNLSRWQALHELASCNVHYGPPVGFHPPRTCIRNVIETCPDTCLNPRLQELCEGPVQSYTKSYATTTYKNIHCATCNLYTPASSREEYTVCGYTDLSFNYFPVSMAVTLRLTQYGAQDLSLDYVDITCYNDAVILPDGWTCDNILCPGDYAIGQGMCVALHTDFTSTTVIEATSSPCLTLPVEYNASVRDELVDIITLWLVNNYTISSETVEANLTVSCLPDDVTHFALSFYLYSDINETALPEMEIALVSVVEYSLLDILRERFNSSSPPLFAIYQPPEPHCEGRILVEDTYDIINGSIYMRDSDDVFLADQYIIVGDTVRLCSYIEENSRTALIVGLFILIAVIIAAVLVLWSSRHIWWGRLAYALGRKEEEATTTERDAKPESHNVSEHI